MGFTFSESGPGGFDLTEAHPASAARGGSGYLRGESGGAPRAWVREEAEHEPGPAPVWAAVPSSGPLPRSAALSLGSSRLPVVWVAVPSGSPLPANSVATSVTAGATWCAVPSSGPPPGPIASAVSAFGAVTWVALPPGSAAPANAVATFDATRTAWVRLAPGEVPAAPVSTQAASDGSLWAEVPWTRPPAGAPDIRRDAVWVAFPEGAGAPAGALAAFQTEAASAVTWAALPVQDRAPDGVDIAGPRRAHDEPCEARPEELGPMGSAGSPCAQYLSRTVEFQETAGGWPSVITGGRPAATAGPPARREERPAAVSPAYPPDLGAPAAAGPDTLDPDTYLGL